MVSFWAEIAQRLYQLPDRCAPEHAAEVLVDDDFNSMSSFIDVGAGAGRGLDRFDLQTSPDELLRCKAFFRPAPYLTIKANGELATCRITCAGEGYGNLHQSDLVTLLNTMQEREPFKVHAERRIGEYRRFVDPEIFGRYFHHMCTIRAILTLFARYMAEDCVDPLDNAAVAYINRRVAHRTGHLKE